MEDPRRCEESRPGLHCIIKDLGFGAHKKARIASNLAQVRITHLGLNDRVDKVKGKGVLFHTHRIKIIESKFTNALN